MPYFRGIRQQLKPWNTYNNKRNPIQMNNFYKRYLKDNHPTSGNQQFVDSATELPLVNYTNMNKKGYCSNFHSFVVDWQIPEIEEVINA